MPAILIDYDLNVPGQKYDKLIEKIKAYPGYAKLMRSTWIVAGSTLTPEKVTDDLRAVVDGSDRLFAVDITGQPNQGWLSESTWEWINKDV
ncbi:hypothetical protein [Agromyces mariniharenae]|uniref:SinR family protein n=1 Tax=Agromyces mariniharenae TaxID=2604423 RepID=A0A5S4UWD5_9MICO|nr:hypothetical protein [Agromyces mariniharenae]TYL50478.1 hypothetical protein FYC51_14850 [Agromyces mariniharenae]